MMTKKIVVNFPEISKIVSNCVRIDFWFRAFFLELINLGQSEPWVLNVIL